MEKEELDRLLDKDDFNFEDYMELKKILAEKEKEYYRLREKYREAAFGKKK